MKLLKVSELKEGCIYLCNLSDRKVLITSISKKKDNVRGNYIECEAMAYHDGCYDVFDVSDNMLSLLSS